MATKKKKTDAATTTGTASSATTPPPPTSTGATRAPRRRIARTTVQLEFETVRIEGALLSPEWLTKVARLDAPSQREDDYRIEGGLSMREELARYWKIARNAYVKFKASRDAGGDPHAAAETFVVYLLKTVFGFDSLAPTAPLVVGDHTYPVAWAALGGRVPVVVAPAPQKGEDLETTRPEFGDVGKKKSAFALVQEFLNVRDEALWGLCCDGVTLRLVRDNASLTRPAFVEADLERLFGEERYTDFSALWLLVHASRFGAADQPVHECPLERWREEGQRDGTRARDHLRDSVEEALKLLGNGFLRHKDSTALRQAVRDGALTAMGYYQQLLRLVYRQIFLLAAEERGLLHPDDGKDSAPARTLYAQGYSLRRLRERAVRRTAWDRHHDVWSSLQIVFGALDQGDARLALPALAGLFAAHQCPDIDAARIENREFLHALYKLAWLPEESGISRVNWRDMGPEELGSVYESLLELVPQFVDDGRGFAWADENQGNARKTSGSYYTPASLVDVLLDSALDPVMKDAEAAHPEDPAGALLSLSIVDPACGSGHFLLAAARRLASRVAAVRAEGTPSRKEYQHALREVVGKCIYGVDLNPMAVELCKVALWMEAVEPGLPLTFLNSHIQHGNALLGTTPELMEKGIPDAAWQPIEGDDRPTASALKKRNKEERALPSLPGALTADAQAAVAASAATVEAHADVDLASLVAKEAHYDALLSSSAYRHQKLVADAWCSAFVWPKQPGNLALSAPTQGTWKAIEYGEPPLAWTATTVSDLAQTFCFFHWHLQFPQVFATGGFDLVLGNPPWDLLEDKVGNLPTRKHNAEQHFFGQGVFSVLSGRRDLYKLFLAAAPWLLKPTGRLGFLTPVGVFIEDESSTLRTMLYEKNSVLVLRHFQNGSQSFFGHVHASYRICLVVCTRTPGFPHALSTTAAAPSQIPHQHHMQFPPGTIKSVLGEGYATVIYDDARYASTHATVMAACGPMHRIAYRVVAEFHGSTDKKLLLSAPTPASWAILKNRNIHHFNHLFSPPEAWVAVESVRERLFRKGLADPPWASDMPRLVFRDIARSDDERTLIACLAPPGNVSTYDTPMLVPECASEALPERILWMTAAASSFAVDFLIRPFVDKHVKPYTIARAPWLEMPSDKGTIPDLVLQNVAELAFNDDGFVPFFSKLGLVRPASSTVERRFLLRAELDAAFLHVYGFSRDAADYVMETFPIVKRKDEAAHGDYRTKRVILEMYDAMADAIRTGIPYQTRLAPPPADPRVHAHPESSRPVWATKPS